MMQDRSQDDLQVFFSKRKLIPRVAQPKPFLQNTGKDFMAWDRNIFELCPSEGKKREVGTNVNHTINP